jgi:hypothetical protein
VERLPTLGVLVLSQSALQRPAGTGKRRTDRRHNPTVADHDERLMVGLDTVEHIGEVSGGIGGT